MTRHEADAVALHFHDVALVAMTPACDPRRVPIARAVLPRPITVRTVPATSAAVQIAVIPASCKARPVLRQDRRTLSLPVGGVPSFERASHEHGAIDDNFAATSRSVRFSFAGIVRCLRGTSLVRLPAFSVGWTVEEFSGGHHSREAWNRLIHAASLQPFRDLRAPGREPSGYPLLPRFLFRSLLFPGQRNG